MNRKLLDMQWHNFIKQGVFLAKGSLDKFNRQIKDATNNQQQALQVNEEKHEHEIHFPLILYYQEQRPCTTFPCNNRKLVSQNLDNAIFLTSCSTTKPIRLRDVKCALLQHISGRHLTSVYDCHYRFKCQGIDSVPPFSYVWLDIDDDNALIPLFDNSIYMKILCQPRSKVPFGNRSGIRHQNQVLAECCCTLPSQSEKGRELLCQKKQFDAFGNSVQNVPHSGQQKEDRGKTDYLTEQISSKTSIDDKRVQEALSNHKAKQRDDQARLEAADAVDARLQEELDAWAFNEDRNYKDIRALLSTLPNVLWDMAQWNKVSMADLILASKDELRKVYRSAILVTHPDKHQSSTLEVQYRAGRIFTALNESFKLLK